MKLKLDGYIYNSSHNKIGEYFWSPLGKFSWYLYGDTYCHNFLDKEDLIAEIENLGYTL